ncbi:hypothetical protein CEXT_229711 [Caerostris extrusa]|uniref:Uncharacterized protein n=1 Tax=Caerostris extrusa TaxID=172846 RepID=A0AAV4SV64_CAEEX|nr:hypothetical protein CEXT_229711 [Caerostris extrusa]
MADVQGKLLTESLPFLVDGVALVAAPVAAGEPLEDEGVAADDVRPGAVVGEGLVANSHPTFRAGGWRGSRTPAARSRPPWAGGRPPP